MEEKADLLVYLSRPCAFCLSPAFKLFALMKEGSQGMNNPKHLCLALELNLNVLCVTFRGVSHRIVIITAKIQFYGAGCRGQTVTTS